MSSTEIIPVVVIGAGPAGLTAAYELVNKAPHIQPLVLEASSEIGGIARTVVHNGNRFDIGGHRFFTKVPEVNAMWNEVLGEGFVSVRRLSRIYYGGKFYSYPLQVGNALTNLGVQESFRIILSYLKWRIIPHRVEENFEQWVMNRFGGRLYWMFFKSYTEKVWGIPCTEVRADWAAQRIKNLSLLKALWNAVTGANNTTSLIDRFDYPRLGPGMMWEAFRDRLVERGGRVRTSSSVTRLCLAEDRIVAVETTGVGGVAKIAVDHVISSMPLNELIPAFDPAPPAEVLAAAARLRYRDFLIVTLVLDRPDPFPDNWIYVHSPSVKVGRIQNFRAWSKDMVANPNHASIGMEYFCQTGDSLWQSSDAELIALGTRELSEIGLADPASVVDGCVVRQPRAYPVYDSDYLDALTLIRRWLVKLKNFQTIGRNGMHRYNNQDHSMLTGILAARNIMGAKYDLWAVNVERSYHEELVVKPASKTSGLLAELGQSA